MEFSFHFSFYVGFRVWGLPTNLLQLPWPWQLTWKGTKCHMHLKTAIYLKIRKLNKMLRLQTTCLWEFRLKKCISRMNLPVYFIFGIFFLVLYCRQFVQFPSFLWNSCPRTLVLAQLLAPEGRQTKTEQTINFYGEFNRAQTKNACSSRWSWERKGESMTTKSSVAS